MVEDYQSSIAKNLLTDQSLKWHSEIECTIYYTEDGSKYVLDQVELNQK
jgi:hypothetical protein